MSYNKKLKLTIKSSSVNESNFEPRSTKNNAGMPNINLNQYLLGNDFNSNPNNYHTELNNGNFNGNYNNINTSSPYNIKRPYSKDKYDSTSKNSKCNCYC